MAQDAKGGILNNEWEKKHAPGTNKILIKSSYVKFDGNFIKVNSPFDIITEFWCEEEGFPINVSMHLYDINESLVFAISTANIPLSKGIHKASFHIPANLMNDGNYVVHNLFVTNSQGYFNHTNANSFEIFEERTESGWHDKWPGNVRPTFIKNEII